MNALCVELRDREQQPQNANGNGDLTFHSRLLEVVVSYLTIEPLILMTLLYYVNVNQTLGSYSCRCHGR